MYYISANRIGSKIHERYLDENLVERSRIVSDYKPSFFYLRDDGDDNKYKSIDGLSCKREKCESIDEFIKRTTDAKKSGLDVLGQDDIILQYISDTYKDNIDVGSFIKKIRVANVDIEVPAPEFPSPNTASYEITSIAHYDSILDQYHVFTFNVNKHQKWSAEKSILSKEVLDKVVLYQYDDEYTMLIKYIGFWRTYMPAIITGYNTDGFDIPYIYNRITDVLGERLARSLSPHNKVYKKLVIDWSLNTPADKKTEAHSEAMMAKGAYHYEIDIVGVASLDFLSLYKKYSFTSVPSYRLDAIGELEVGESKIHFNHNFMEIYGKSDIIQKSIDQDSAHEYEYYAYMKHLLNEKTYNNVDQDDNVVVFMDSLERVDTKEKLSLFKKYIENIDNRTNILYDNINALTIRCAYQMVTDYNIKDVELVNRLDVKRGFINLALSIAYYAKINYSAVYSPIKTWDAILFNSIKEYNGVIPKRTNERKSRYIGGYVKEPIKGLYKYIVSFDYESLYPKIIGQLNISPETYIHTQEPNLPQDIPAKYDKELYPHTMWYIDELLSGNMIYDNSEYSISPNGASYTKEKEGIIPKEINKVFNNRKAWKKVMMVHEKNIEKINDELTKRGLNE